MRDDSTDSVYQRVVRRGRGVQLALQLRQRQRDEIRRADADGSGTAASGRLQHGQIRGAALVRRTRRSM
jgi:hypothetical protein